jgi:hypothetical protein
MAAYILPEDVHSKAEDALGMGAGVAEGILRLTADLTNTLPPGEEAERVLAIMGCARHLATSLQEAADQLDSVNLKKLSREEVSHG